MAIQTEYKLQTDLTDEDLQRLLRSEAVAIDTEMTGLNPHRDILCLVQVCDHDGLVNFIRTDNWKNTPRLQALLADAAVMKIFHYAVMDGSFLLKNTGVESANLYCTKVASKIARTYSPEHGLSKLVGEMLDIKLDKTQQTSFWLAPHLTPAQLKYAASDVMWLNELRIRLGEIMDLKGSLPGGPSYREINERCRAFLPTLIQLFLHGWDIGTGDRNTIFSH
ncbi:MAG: ribonuclease D [Candidatus Methylacidiphilales bacterium]